MKYIFSINNSGDFATTEFSIEAETQEKAEVFARQLNPGARLVRTEGSATKVEDKLLF